jgi:hypothetical protein
MTQTSQGTDEQGRHLVKMLGLPGMRSYIYYSNPAEPEPRQAGAVTIVLARPEAPPDPYEISIASETEGDSHIAICRPAIDVDSPTRSLTFETYIAEIGRTIIFHGIANTKGYLGKFVVSDLSASDPIACEVAAMALVTPTMTLLSYANDVPMSVWRIYISPAGTAQSFVRVTVPFAAKRHGNRHQLFSLQFSAITSAYREGLNLCGASPLYAFISFYRVIEASGSFQQGTTTNATRAQQRVPKELGEITTWLAGIMEVTSVSIQEAAMIVPEEARGRKYNWIIDQLREIRNQIAHGLLEEHAAPLSVDDATLQNSVQRWMPLCRILARSRMNELAGPEDVPLGLPSAVAMQNRSAQAADAAAPDGSHGTAPTPPSEPQV